MGVFSKLQRLGCSHQSSEPRPPEYLHLMSQASTEDDGAYVTYIKVEQKSKASITIEEL